MGAHLNEVMSNGYILDEVKLRKLVSIIEDRFLDSRILFTVYFGDSSFYKTESIEKVVEDQNQEWRSIKRINLSCLKVFEGGRGVSFSLSFGRVISINIEGDDRDFVFVLFSDLRAYIGSEVSRKKPFFSNHFHFVLFLGFIFGVVFISAVVYSTYQQSGVVLDYNKAVREVLISNDIEVKLNFLINKRKIAPDLNIIYLLCVSSFILFVASSGFPHYIYRKLFPKNLFLFGHKKEQYEKKQDLIGKVFWGVIVALLVSVISGLAVWKLTS